MKHFFYFASCVMAFLLIGCNQNLPYQPPTGDGDTGGSSNKKTYLTTGETSDVTHNSAVLYAQTNVDTTKYELISYGFMYATSQELVEEHDGSIVWSEEKIENETYSATVTDLEADQDYYYCAVVLLNGEVWKYSKINEFHTSVMEEPEDPNALPMIESPGYGKVTIAVRAPEGTCNGMVAVGAATNWDGSDDWDPSAQDKKFTKIDGKENWYQITLPANYGIAVKVIAISSTGRADWNTQWGMNTLYDNPNVVILDGEGYLDNSENGGEVKLTELVENTVVYVDVLAWKSEPCLSNKNEAGWATFHVTVPYDTPSYAQVSVAGSFDESAWTPGAYLLTRLNDGTYYGEFYIPEAFEYKYIVGCDGLTWSWEYEEVIAGNRVMPLDLYARDVVEAWYNIPENPNQGSTGWENGYEWVDLGLPSGLKWATCNVGANKPEDYGDYFAWGEVEPKDYYDWSMYKWCNGSYDTQTKYCTDSYYGTVDDKTTLELSDDAANYNWGGAWRMPTGLEWSELIDNCSWTWADYGHVVTGPNGNSIFLPAAGYRDDSSLYNAGSYGIYWSSSLNSDNPSSAWSVLFYSDGVDRGNYYRLYGFSVRPVCQ